MDVAIIILAAGLGTRMKSDKAKVLHEILGKPMIRYVVETAEKVAGNNVIVLVGHQAEIVRNVVSEHHRVLFALQEKQLGTGHAVSCAMPSVPDHVRHIIILCGDVPLIREKTLRRLFETYETEKRDISLIAAMTDDPKGYGRVITDKNNEVVEIVEEKDASEEQRKTKLVNTGIYCIRTEFLKEALGKIRSDNVQGEYYLTDIVGIAHEERRRIGMVVSDDIEEFVGVNTHRHLSTAEEIMRKRIAEIS